MTATQERIDMFRQRQEKIIQEYGYMIQAVFGGDKNFTYTIGRNDVMKTDFLIYDCGADTSKLIKEILDLDDKKLILSNVIYESEFLSCKNNSKEKIRYRVKPVRVDDYADKVLGIVNRYNEPSQVCLQLSLIEKADDNNKFLEEYPVQNTQL